MAENVDFLLRGSKLRRPVRCRACGRPIVFIDHPRTGRRFPLDVDSKRPGPEPRTWRLESHFAHCTSSAGDSQSSTPAAPRRDRGATEIERERRELYGRGE